MRTELKALFKLQHDLVERLKRPAQEPPPPVLLHYQPLQPTSMQFDVSLRDGRVQADTTLTGRDIARHLNQPDKHYVADGPSAAGTLRMKDERQYVFHIQSTPAVAAVFKSSLADTTGGVGESPGRAHVGSVSAVQTTVDGQQFRLEGQRLFRFEPLTLSWVPDADSRALSRIGLTNEGQLLKTPKGFADSSAHGRTTVQLSQTLDASFVQVQGGSVQALQPVDEAGVPVQLARIGLSGNTLYGATTDGELVQADLRMARGQQLPMVGQPVDSLERALKGAVRVEGFFHDDQGQLNAKVRDARQQLHSVPLREASDLRPQWNLSDVLVKGIEKGLPLPSQQALAAAVDLGQRGRVALDAGSLLTWDAAAQRWQDTAQPGVEHLERGLDGRAYVLQDGQLKAVTIGKVRDPLIEGASHDLAALPIPRPHVSVDEVLVGNDQRRITGFAVVDGRNFVTVDQDHQLQVHHDGDARPLHASPSIDIKTLALDHVGNLYAHTRGGELFRLDRQAWQGNTASAQRWSRVELPGRQPLESLRMGADHHLIGGWDKQFFQLDNASTSAMEWGPLPLTTQAPSLADTLASTQMRGQFSGGALTVSSNVMGQTREGIPLKRSFFQGIGAHFHPLEALGQKAKGVAQHFNGRKGLESVYADDQRLHQQLNALAQSRPVSADLNHRLAALSEPGPRQALAEQIRQALTQVEQSSQSSARRMGDAHGLAFDPKPTLSRAKVNPDSTLHQLYEAFKRVSSSSQKPTAALLANFEGQGLTLPASKPGNKRDLDHPSALIEGDLIHHASTLKQLADLVQALDATSGYSPSALTRIEASLRDVMQTFKNSPVHTLVSQGIASYEQAESLYGNFKLLAKDLGTPGSALHWHLSGLLGLPTDASIKEAMTQQIQQLGSGQTLSPSRTQGKSLGLLMTEIKPIAPVEFYLGVSKSHTHGVSISRTDKGARVEISSDDMRRLAGSVGSGLTLGRGSEAVGPGLRVAAELTAAVAKNKGASIAFDVKEADFGKMMSILTGETGSVYDLLALGEAHTAGKSSKVSSDVNVDALAQLRLMYNPQEDIAELDSVIRAGVGGVASLNLFHKDTNQSAARTETGTSHSTATHTQFLRQGGVGANIAPFNTLALVRAESGGPSMIGFALPDLSVMVKFDRGVSQAFNFAFKHPQPVSQSQVDELKHSVSLYSPTFRRELASTELSEGTVDQQLATLQQFLATHPSLATKPDAYHAISQSLDKLMNQQNLARNGLRQLASVESSVTRVGLRDDGRHAWLDDVAPANKAAIEQWMKDDPQFAQVLDQLQRGEGTSITLGMEIKPEVLRAIERSHLAGESTEPLIKRALSDRNNLRVKHMSLGYTATQSHGMSIPAMTNLSFSSSAGLSHSQKLVNADLEYGQDPDKPLRMNLNDTLGSLPSPDLTIDLGDLRVRTQGLSAS
ncbi:AvrE-family type 3 secretion system effector [Pseudomonas sp. P7759]|uniref:AvrE-family type 3 secretion system effector n=1 Tax=Pseudomonas sp. P7759 TaxID=2738831 RepID=UPI0015A3BAB0|nr:AvrE-family type 3 secretion system effector [Pseudomonas sp. P7759]NWC74165.1 AvrE-family type 3 secretion system effector [Pseudomonas sp. P7759]